MAFFVGSSVPQIIFTGSIDLANVAANTVADQTVTINGLTQDMAVLFQVTSDLTAGLVISHWYVSANNTLKIRFYNTTGGGIDEAAATFKVMAF